MKKIVAENITLGPFQVVTESGDRYIADGFEIPFAILDSPVVTDVSDSVNKSVPQEITMRQARLALHEAGLLSNVSTAIASLSEPAKTKAQIEWEYSNALQRDNPFVTTLGTALGLSSDDIDNLFITASGL